MNLTNISIEVPSNIFTLALFACNLFISGNFHDLHLIFDTNTSDVHRFIGESGSICTIPLIVFELAEISSLHALSLELPERNDHILQIIFIDRNSNELNEQLELLDKFPVYYRSFILSPDENIENHLSNLFGRSPLGITILFRNQLNNGIHVYQLPSMSFKLVHIQQKKSENQNENVFDIVYGGMPFVVLRETSYTRYIYQNASELNIAYNFISNYYMRQLDIAFRFIIFRDKSNSLEFHIDSPEKSIYKEIFSETLVMDSATM